MKKGFMVIGMSSFRSFPVFNEWENRTDFTMSCMDRTYIELMKNFAAFCHNTRNPSVEIRPTVKVSRLNYAHSD